MEIILQAILGVDFTTWMDSVDENKCLILCRHANAIKSATMGQIAANELIQNFQNVDVHFCHVAEDKALGNIYAVIKTYQNNYGGVSCMWQFLCLLLMGFAMAGTNETLY